MGKNVLCIFGRSAQTVHKTEQLLAVLLLCSLHCMRLLNMKFCCQVGILAVENRQDSVIPIGACTFLPVREGVTWYDSCLHGRRE